MGFVTNLEIFGLKLIQWVYELLVSQAIAINKVCMRTVRKIRKVELKEKKNLRGRSFKNHTNMHTVFILRKSCRGKSTVLSDYTAWTSLINDPEKTITKITISYNSGLCVGTHRLTLLEGYLSQKPKIYSFVFLTPWSMGN